MFGVALRHGVAFGLWQGHLMRVLAAQVHGILFHCDVHGC